MTEEERNKAIEWLLGSIQRSAAGGSNTNFVFLFLSIILIAFGFFMMFFFEDAEGALILFTLGGVLLFSTLIGHVTNKKIAQADTPQGLLAVHDRMMIFQAVVFMVVIVGCAILDKGSFVSKICFVLSGVLLLIAGWLSMQQRLRLWAAIGLLIAECAFLYFSGVGLLVGLPLLLVMLSIMKGEKTLFASKDSEGLDEEDEQDFKHLRKLLKESESSIEMNSINK